MFYTWLVLALFAGLAASQNATTIAVTTALAPTTASPNVTTVAPTTPTPAPAYPAETFDRSQSCPFSRWGGAPRYCYECRWCPFRESTCCEMEDEIDVLKSVSVSGSADWDCFITIVHFQQCGRCDPNSTQYATDRNVTYAVGPFNFTIRPCKQACRYIHKQCKDASTLAGQPVVPPGVGEEQFCEGLPETSTPDSPCYNAAAGRLGSLAAFALLVVGLVTAFGTLA